MRSSAGRRRIASGGPCSTIRPRVHEDDPVGHLAGERDLVGHDHHRPPLLGELAHHLQHLAHQLRVEGGGRLVEQDQLGLHRQHAGDGDALLLPAREPLRDSPRPCGARPTLASIARASSAASARDEPLHPARRQGDVAERRQVREQVEALEDEADLGPLGRHLAVRVVARPAAPLLLADPPAVDPDLAAGRPLEEVHAAQERGLARPGRADQRQHLAARHLERDAAQHLERAEALPQAEDADERVRGGIGPGQLPGPHLLAELAQDFGKQPAGEDGAFQPSGRSTPIR